jgi:hypothetical protein
VVLVSTEDKDLVEAFRRSASGDGGDRARSRTGRSIEVEAVPPA